jgi:hypothetical protein
MAGTLPETPLCLFAALVTIGIDPARIFGLCESPVPGLASVRRCSAAPLAAERERIVLSTHLTLTNTYADVRYSAVPRGERRVASQTILERWHLESPPNCGEGSMAVWWCRAIRVSRSSAASGMPRSHRCYRIPQDDRSRAKPWMRASIV